MGYIPYPLLPFAWAEHIHIHVISKSVSCRSEVEEMVATRLQNAGERNASVMEESSK